MKTLLQSALTGWTTYTQQGKFVALLLVAIVYLGRRLLAKNGDKATAPTIKDNPKLTGLYIYAILITLGCIFPVTALILMKYQTAFYSYVWIWAAVPQTALIAWAGTEFLCDLWKNVDGTTTEIGSKSPQHKSKVRHSGKMRTNRILCNSIVTLLLLGIVFLSGNPVSDTAQTQTTRIPIPVLEKQLQHKQEPSAWEILEMLSVYHDMENNKTEKDDANNTAKGTQDYTIWAPKEVMAAARAFSAHIRPVYGRSIWDASLGSYSFDTYATWQEDLYLWMSNLEDTGETEYLRTDEVTQTPGTTETAGESGGRRIDFAACLDSARTAGVDYILLPGNLSEETLTELGEAVGTGLQAVGAYYLIVLS